MLTEPVPDSANTGDVPGTGERGTKLPAAGVTGPWSRDTRDRWFYGALGVATAALLVLFSPFLHVLLVASVVVVVAWPLFERVRRACRGRRELAAVLTTLIVGALVFGPASLLAALFVHQALALIGSAIELVGHGGAEQLLQASARQDWVPSWLRSLVPADFDLLRSIAGSLEQGLLRMLEAAGGAVPELVGTTMAAGVDGAILLLAVVALFVEGPQLLAILADLSPLDDAYEARLFAVYSQFSRNVVLGTLASAGVQGALAAVGYAIVGVDSLVFFAVLTAACGLVPVVGTVLVWGPLALAAGVEHGLGWGLFLACWGLVVAHADNFVRPLFLRGRTHIHPLLLLLGVFGGLAWMGVRGALVGPLVVIVFVVLYRLHVEHNLGRLSR